jgi:HEAT repeat protein
MQSKKMMCLISLIIGIAMFVFICAYAQKSLNGKKQQQEEMKKQVIELLENRQFDEVAKLGESVVPALIEIVRDKEYKFPAEIVEILGEIGDKRATPLLEEMLQIKGGPITFALRSIEQIGDTSAEKAVLKIFEDEKVWPSTRLLSGRVLLKIGGKKSKTQVVDLVTQICSLYVNLYSSDPQNTQRIDSLTKKIDELGFGDPDATFRALEDILSVLRNVHILSEYGLKWGFLGKKQAEGIKLLEEIGNPRAIETLLNIIENDASMWPPMYNLMEFKQTKNFERFTPSTRITAAKALGNLGDQVSRESLKKVLESIEKDYPEYKDKVAELKRQIEK